MSRVPHLKFPIKIDIGCGMNKIDEHIGIDILDYDQEIVWDVRCGLPLPDNSVELVHSSHFFEHLTWEEVVKLFPEIVRVCSYGAIVTIIVPHNKTKEAFDVCHKSFWSKRMIEGICFSSKRLKLVSTKISGINLIITIEIS